MSKVFDMNFAKSIFLFSLFSCTLVELINSGSTHANELSTNVSKSTSTLVDLASTSTVENPSTAKTTGSLRTEPRDTKDFHLVSISPINEALNPEVSTKKSNSSLAQAAGRINSPNQMQDKKNDIGLAVQFGNSTSFGVQGKVGLTDNISIRPEVFFSSGTNLESPKDTLLGNFNTFPNNADNSFTLPSTLTINENFTTPVRFTTTAPVSFNRDIVRNGVVVIPAGTILPAGSVVPAGDIIPAGSILPAGFVLPAGITIPNAVASAGFAKAKTTGTSFGVAVTYDLKLDPQAKSTAYFGPKVTFASASGPLTIGANAPGVTINTSETKIGLVAGVDYAVSDGFTIGANATYNFSRSVSGTGSLNGQTTNIDSILKPVGSALDFGIRIGYQF